MRLRIADFLGLSLREMIHEFKYQTLVLFKCLLLQPKVCFSLVQDQIDFNIYDLDAILWFTLRETLHDAVFSDIPHTWTHTQLGRLRRSKVPISRRQYGSADLPKNKRTSFMYGNFRLHMLRRQNWCLILLVLTYVGLPLHIFGKVSDILLCYRFLKLTFGREACLAHIPPCSSWIS